MRGFLSLFTDSARELKQVRTITVAALFMALSIVLRTIAIPIGTDIRITFAFLGVMIIAMLYGPVVSMIAALGTDIIGYLLDGLLFSAVLARLTVVLIGNLVLNSSILYACYINPDFPFAMSGSAWSAFGTWMLPRLIKNVGQFPFDVIMICVLLPIVVKAYQQVFHKSVLRTVN